VELYTEKDLVRIAKRENNNKRRYLVANPLQAKHIPAAPDETFALFGLLADILAGRYKNEKILAIGFAETATAIGARVAIKMDCLYMQTTREDIEGASYLYFTESHSHATEQKLVRTDLDKIIDRIDRIIFIEDEVTTGNTIMKIINIIKDTYKIHNGRIQFSVASLINGMDKESINLYKENNINIHYIVKTDNSRYTKIAEGFADNGSYITDLDSFKNGSRLPEIKRLDASGYSNARRLVQGSDYNMACEKLWQQVQDFERFTGNESILVIGTEEFMYPAIYIAYMAGLQGCTARCHSTTRSPVATSQDAGYPLHCRYSLRSVYDSQRQTFIYDIGCYDKVIIITDAAGSCEDGINDLCKAVFQNNNSSISVIKWNKI